MGNTGFTVSRIAGFGLTSPDAARLAQFYVTAFGARSESSEHLVGAEFEREMGVRGGALRYRLTLGSDAIDILQFEMPGRPYPQPLMPYDAAFQHFALVVSDMSLGFSRLQSTAGWTPISTGGPQHLPQRSGGVTAFKFQDPDGHPLELLQFPKLAIPLHWKARSTQEIFLGIDHSAISVRDTAVSVAFYQSLGFRVSAKSLNHGVEQANLDGVPQPQVDVTALSAPEAAPHVELLCYKTDARAPLQVLASNDVAATHICLAAGRPDERMAGGGATQLVLDPDGHRLLLIS